MFSKKADLLKAKNAALRALKDMEITTLPIDPFQMATDLDIPLQKMPDDLTGVSGMLIRFGNEFGIAYATHIKNKGFVRFSVAHELGHYFIEGHPEHIDFDDSGTHQSHAGFTSQNPYEKEADHFAANLLMPAFLVNNIIQHSKEGLETVEAINSECEVSLTTAAIRYSELTKTPVAIIVTKNKKVDYAFLSSTAKEFSGLTWPRKGQNIPNNTETAKFWEKQENIINCHKSIEDIDLQDWLDGNRSIDAVEEIIGLGSYGRAITILTWPEIDELDEEDEENIQEEWKPHFK